MSERVRCGNPGCDLCRDHFAALAMEARRAETLKDGSVHDSAGPKDNAQPQPGRPPNDY